MTSIYGTRSLSASPTAETPDLAESHIDPCARCGRLVHHDDNGTTWHTTTGCVSCRPVLDPDGGYGEPGGFWSGPCATRATRSAT